MIMSDVEVDVTTAEPQPGPGSAPDIVLNNCSIPEPTQGPSSAQDSVGLFSPSVSEPGGPASHTEDKLRTARVKTREDKKRQLDKFQVVMLESDQQEEFEELYQRGVRHECSDALWLSWLPLKIEAEKVETVEIVCEVDVNVVDNIQVVDGVLLAKVPSNFPKKRTGRNVRKTEGSARFDPQSAEWRQIWEDQETEREEKKDKKKELERKRAEREELKRRKELEKQELDRKRAEREQMKRRKGRPAAAAPPLQSTSPPTETSGEPSPSGQASRESPNVQVDTEGIKERTNNENEKRKSSELSQDQGLRRSKRRK